MAEGRPIPQSLQQEVIHCGRGWDHEAHQWYTNHHKRCPGQVGSTPPPGVIQEEVTPTRKGITPEGDPEQRRALARAWREGWQARVEDGGIVGPDITNPYEVT